MLRLTVNQTHFYLVECRGGFLLVDAGWELSQFTAQLRSSQVEPESIRYVMFTHHHPDHAGLVQQIKELCGARLIIQQEQIPYLDALAGYYAKKGGYRPIRIEPGDLISPDRETLTAIGMAGEIVPTPGHSDDSFSLLLDDGSAFIGDLTWLELAGEENFDTLYASWQRLVEQGAQVFYPSHAGPIPVEAVRRILP